MYFLYSPIVVAPIHWSSPLARAGFKMFEALTAPSAPPAPTTVCNSSIKVIIFPSFFFISSRSFFILSSNSPLYFVPATSPPISRAMSLLFFNTSGTFPDTILCAIPSTIAVLPTPGSPIRTGLFFVLLERILNTLPIS